MKKIIYTLILIIISILIWDIIHNRESNNKKFNPLIKLHNYNKIYSRNVPKYLDTIVDLGLEELNIQNQIVLIKPISIESKSNFGFGTLKGYIVGKGGNYTIWIDELSRVESIKVIGHELIHLQQYESKRLIPYKGLFLIWKGDTLDVNQIPYNDRGWEIEAFEKGDKLNHKLYSILYSK